MHQYIPTIIHKRIISQKCIELTDLSITKHGCQAPREILLHSGKATSRITGLPGKKIHTKINS